MSFTPRPRSNGPSITGYSRETENRSPAPRLVHAKGHGSFPIRSLGGFRAGGGPAFWEPESGAAFRTPVLAGHQSDHDGIRGAENLLVEFPQGDAKLVDVRADDALRVADAPVFEGQHGG